MQDRKKLVSNFLNGVWNDKGSRDKDPLYSAFSKDLIINSPLGKEIGCNKLKKINDKWLLAFPGLTLSSVEVECYKEVVVTQWVSEAIHENFFNDLPSTGKKIHYPGETIFYISKGQIVRYSCHVDMVNIHKQLGFFYKKQDYEGQSILANNRTKLIAKLMEMTNHKLTPREIECLCLTLMGFSAKQVGKILSISHRTVETHLQRAVHEAGFCSKLHFLEHSIEMNTFHMWQDLGKIIIEEFHRAKKSLCGS